MTAIKIQTQGVHSCRRPKIQFLEIFTRSLIILCMALAIILSSISVCDGHWLFANAKVFGLWHFCIIEQHGVPNCTTDLNVASIHGLQVGLIFSRTAVSFVVVAAIFGLELLIVSQVCEDLHSRKKWSFGSQLVLLSFALSAAGMLSFVIWLWNQVSFMGFTLTYWCQFTAVFLFFLNGISGLHIHSLMQLPIVHPGKM
ncbi:voltage-dependent calcium channel gamma-like subunit [Polyodon spathula]|uniref:voltage-dependent calcium channel gamma-like subunit n=1 Tax=Polyodon spathula TaxID=7913 RepID=UPI001B7EAE0A|nr:voltage-dependent calcium channel gamma-like subunit [Polyodon spathula]